MEVFKLIPHVVSQLVFTAIISRRIVPLHDKYG